MSAPIPLQRWGKDHWSTFAFVAHWCAEYGSQGFAVASPRHRRQMRVDADIHPGLAHSLEIAGARRYPTRLNDGTEVERHDDYSCVEDMEAEGLVEWGGTGLNPVLRMTARGLTAAGVVATHKTEGGQFGDRWLSLRVWQGLLGPGNLCRGVRQGRRGLGPSQHELSGNRETRDALAQHERDATQKPCQSFPGSPVSQHCPPGAGPRSRRGHCEGHRRRRCRRGSRFAERARATHAEDYMSTNFYLVDTAPCPLCGADPANGVRDRWHHLGKRAGGWNFIFRGYPDAGPASTTPCGSSSSSSPHRP